MALGAQRRERCARWTETKFRLVTREARQPVLGAELVCEEDFYRALDECHDAMHWLGPQLQV